MTASPPPGRLAWAIAIPARNDAERIGACLAALARQRDVAMAEGAIVVFASNSSDDTPRIARESRQPCALRVIQHNPLAQSTRGQPGSKGEARRLALAQARLQVRDDGIVLTTDTNVIVGPTWIAAMLDCFADPCIDAVAGAICTDETTPEPRPVPDIAALERQYQALMCAVEDAIDPQPHDPPPRHGQETGSNLGIRARVLDSIGGVPVVTTGTARAIFSAVRGCDGRVRHALAPWVRAAAPPRRDIAESMAPVPRHPAQSAIHWPAAIVERRLTFRKAARAAFSNGAFAEWAKQHGVTDWPAQACFGSSWAGFVARSPGLAPTPVDAAALPAQIAMLEYLLAHASDRV